MAFLEEIQGYVLSRSTRFQAGSSTGPKTPIWLGRFPTDDTATAVAFFQYGGSAPQFTFSASTAPNLPYFKRPSLQVISRAPDYITAELNANRIYDILAAAVNTVFPSSAGSTATGDRYLRLGPNQEPFDMGRDANRREQFSCNYLIEKEPA